MISEKVAQLLNAQINKEFYSAYLYLSIANYYNEKGLKGFANWYNVQAQEERDHALLFIQYLQNNDLPVVLEAIAQPHAEPADLAAPLSISLEHERYVTEQIHIIYHAASEIHDYRTLQFLDWFVKEQGEEEANATDLITRMNLFGTDAKGLYMLDQELGTRLYSAPSLTL